MRRRSRMVAVLFALSPVIRTIPYMHTHIHSCDHGHKPAASTSHPLFTRLPQSFSSPRTVSRRLSSIYHHTHLHAKSSIMLFMCKTRAQSVRAHTHTHMQSIPPYFTARLSRFSTRSLYCLVCLVCILPKSINDVANQITIIRNAYFVYVCFFYLSFHPPFSHSPFPPTSLLPPIPQQTYHAICAAHNRCGAKFPRGYICFRGMVVWMLRALNVCCDMLCVCAVFVRDDSVCVGGPNSGREFQSQ